MRNRVQHPCPTRTSSISSANFVGISSLDLRRSCVPRSSSFVAFVYSATPAGPSLVKPSSGRRPSPLLGRILRLRLDHLAHPTHASQVSATSNDARTGPQKTPADIHIHSPSSGLSAVPRPLKRCPSMGQDPSGTPPIPPSSPPTVSGARSFISPGHLLVQMEGHPLESQLGHMHDFHPHSLRSDTSSAPNAFL